MTLGVRCQVEDRYTPSSRLDLESSLNLMMAVARTGRHSGVDATMNWQ